MCQYIRLCYISHMPRFRLACAFSEFQSLHCYTIREFSQSQIDIFSEKVTITPENQVRSGPLSNLKKHFVSKNVTKFLKFLIKTIRLREQMSFV